MTPETLDNMRWVAHRDPEAVTPDWLVERLDALEAELDGKWLRLPCDADGAPIHVGDRMRYADGDPSGEFDVDGIGDGGTLFSVNEGSCTAWWTTARGKRHVKQRTLEDVLAAFRFDAMNIYGDPTLNGNDRVDELQKLDSTVAAELRELMEVER